MRAVERTPWAERRSSRHDSICLWLAENAEFLTRVAVEEPCGNGFCDVFIETDQRSRAWFVEVKTDAERSSGGDIIRQLRWYAAQRGGFARKELICVSESEDDDMRRLLLAGGVQMVPFQMVRSYARCYMEAK